MLGLSISTNNENGFSGFNRELLNTANDFAVKAFLIKKTFTGDHYIAIVDVFVKANFVSNNVKPRHEFCAKCC